MRVKKGQLRRWTHPGLEYRGKTFLTVSSRVVPREQGLGQARRGEITWTIFEEGELLEDNADQTLIYRCSEVIECE